MSKDQTRPKDWSEFWQRAFAQASCSAAKWAAKQKAVVPQGRKRERKRLKERSA